MHLVDTKLFGNAFADSLRVAGEHHSLAHTAPFQLCNRFCRIRFQFVRNHNVADIFPIERHMHGRTDTVARVPRHAGLLHQFVIACTDGMSVDFGTHAAAGQFFNIRYARCFKLLAIRLAQRARNRMVGIALRQRSKFQQTCFTYPVGMNRRYIENALCQRTGLIEHNDFRIGQPVPGYFEALGIESPGLSSAPAIGAYLAEQAAAYLGAAEKPDFDPLRRDIVHLRELPFEERQRLAAENPAYGNIVCRCEGISEGEIVDAIRRTPGARSLDGVKRRVRAGMGRCQGGFCTPRVMEILSRELGVPQTELTKNGGASRLLAGRTKEEA